MPPRNEDLIRQLQENIHGIGVIEFLSTELEDRYVERAEKFCEDQILSLVKVDTEPRFVQSSRGMARELTLPEKYSNLFEVVYLLPHAETHGLIDVPLYGVIDTDEFRAAREEQMQEQDDSLNIGHAGLNVLREAEKGLSEFIKTEIGFGLFTDGVDDWRHRNATTYTHPSFWIYDLSELAQASPKRYLRDNEVEVNYLGLGGRASGYEPLSFYDDHRCVANRNRRKYLLTELGSFPFRHILLQFETKEEEGEWPRSADIEASELFPHHVPRGGGIGSTYLIRAYRWLFWSLDTYFGLEDYDPEQFEHALDADSKRDKQKTLSKVQDSKFEMREYWLTQRKQFDSIEAAVEERGVFPDPEPRVTDVLIEGASDIQNYCSERVDLYAEEYDGYTERIKSDLDISLSFDVRNMTVAVLFFTLINIFIAISAQIESFPLLNALVTAVGIFLAGYLIFEK